MRKLSTGRANWTATHVDHSVGVLATDTSSVITERLARARRRDDESAAATQNTTPAGFASQFLLRVRWRSDGLVRTQTRDDQWSASHLVSRKNGGLGTRRRIPALFLGWKSDFDDTHDFAAPPTTRRNNRADAFAKKDFHQLLRLRECETLAREKKGATVVAEAAISSGKLPRAKLHYSHRRRERDHSEER